MNLNIVPQLVGHLETHIYHFLFSFLFVPSLGLRSAGIHVESLLAGQYQKTNVYAKIRRPPFRGCHQAARLRCLPVIYSALVSQL